jgi:hypothetical protein
LRPPPADFDREIGLDPALDELRAGLEEIKAIREASGCETHYREAEALWKQAGEIGNRIFETKPLTLAGAIAMLDWTQAEEYEPLTPHWQTIDTVIAGLRDLQAKEVAASPASEAPDDSKILALFREWIAAERYVDALLRREPPPGAIVDTPAWAHVNELHRAIVDTPAAGIVGIAIKAYLQIHDQEESWREDLAALARDSQRWQKLGLLKDVVRFVPELAPLAANALKAPDADDAEAAAVPEILGFGEPEEGGPA